MSEPLDDALLTELREVMGGAFATLVETFIADGERRLDEVACASVDDALRRSAHALKGASANLGAVRLAAACGVLESLARSGEREGRPAALARVQAEFTVARDALRRYASA